MNEESLFNLALEKPAHERSAFLDSACAGNVELRQRVDRLLKAHENPGSFLQAPLLKPPAASPGEATQALAADAAIPMSESRTQAEQGHSRNDDLEFLMPSSRPGALGRMEHYHILQVIGKGGFGTVLKAFDEKLHRVVAIKVLSPELAASGTARQRFIREARTAAAVTHEHVVTIHAVVEEHRPPYLVMQLIDGATLQEKLDKVGMLGLREILRIGMQTAEGLAAAHKQGLVHRDIKPANILLENGVERVKITDFGLAKVADDASVTQSGVVAGTPMYMSPEQANGEPLDHRSDLFSLGTVLYVMCTGRPPFRATGTMGVLKRVIEDTPRPVREINPEIPDWLEEIIAKLHAKKPENRYQTAREVAELLGERLADVQAGRAIGEPSRVSDRVEAPAADVPALRREAATPRDEASSDRKRGRAVNLPATLMLGLLGLFFTFLGATMVAKGGLTDFGKSVAPFLLFAGPSILGWTFLLLLRTPGLRRLAGAFAVVMTLLALVAPACFWRLFGIQAERNPSPEPDPPAAHGTLHISSALSGTQVFLQGHEFSTDFAAPPNAAQRTFSIPPGQYTIRGIRFGTQVYSTTIVIKKGQGESVHIPDTRPAPPPLPPPPPGLGVLVDPGWVPLFNGKDLTGWMNDGPKRWQIVESDGGKLLRGDLPTGIGPAQLTSDSQWGDFHLRARLAIADSEGRNGHGIFVRTSSPGAWKGYGVQFSTPRLAIVRTQDIKKNNDAAWVKNQWIKDGEFFDLDIIARGPALRILINGTERLAYTDPEPMLSNARGQVLVQLREGSLTFSKIEIKDLPPATMIAKSEKELEAAYEEAKKKYQLVKDRQKAGFASAIEVTDAGIEQSEAIVALWTVKSKNSPVVMQGFYDTLVFTYRTRWLIFDGNVKKGLATQAEADAAEQKLRAAEARRNEARKGWGMAPLPPIRLETEPTPVAHFGEWIDPKGDCKYDLKAGAMTITLPPGVHKLDPKTPFTYAGIPMNSANQDAPRLLQEVEGDFTLEVHVRELKLKGKEDTERSFRGAGLVLWQDQDNYLKMLQRPDGALVLAFARGNFVGGMNRSGPSPIALRIERKGKTCVLQLSNNGKDWQTLTAANLGNPFSKWTLPAKLHVGVIAESDSTQSVDCSFDNLRLEGGWSPLCNGKDLTDWKTSNPEFWTAVDGAIQGDVPVSAATPAFLRYMPRLFGNFHLHAEMMVEKGYGTIHFRTQPDILHHGYQFHPEGSLFSGVTQDFIAKGNVDFPRQHWFRLEILANGNRIVCKRDGAVILDYTDPGWHLEAGRLWLQANPSSKIQFRDIKVKELPTAEPVWVQLFNGKDLTGLEVNKANEGVWTVENRILTGTPKAKPPYYIYTVRDDFQNYHLRLQAKLNPGGAGGVYLHLPKQGGGTWKGIAFKLTHRTEGNRGELGISSYPLVPPHTSLFSGKRFLAPDHWFDLEFIKDGPQLQLKLDGASIYQHTFVPEESSRIDPRGVIALEVGDANSVLQVRSFEIKDRPSATVVPAPATTPKATRGS